MIKDLPPTGAPIRLIDIYRGIKALINQEGVVPDFRRMIQEYFAVQDVFLMSSGKAALYVALKSLCSLSERREVVIPAYSSYCLAAAIAKAGLSVKLCDIDPDYLDFDLNHLSHLVDEKTLAIIAVHPFGFAARLREIIQLAKNHSAYILEDFAQAAGTEYRGKKAGTFGDISIFSLGRGKNISAVSGGVILCGSEEVSEAVRQQMQNLTKAPQLPIILTGIIISLFLTPYLYALPATLPFLDIGKNIYDPQFPLNNFSVPQAGIGKSVFHRLDEYNSIRISNATYLTMKLREITNINLVKIATQSQPSFLRFPLLFQNAEMRDRIYFKLKKARLGVSKNYKQPLNKLTEFRIHISNIDDEFVKAERICNMIVTVPTHPLVAPKDLDRIVEIIRYCSIGEKNSA